MILRVLTCDLVRDQLWGKKKRQPWRSGQNHQQNGASSYSGGRRGFEGSQQKLRFAQSPFEMPISRSNNQNNLACRAGHEPFGCWASGRSGDPGVRARIRMLGGNK